MVPRINPIGISSHLERLSQSDVTKQLNLMQSADIQWVRQEFVWSTLEPSSGTWNFSNYDFIVNAILSCGMDIIGLLTQYHTPAWYSTPSNKPPAPQDYAAWISAVVLRYKGQIPLYEIGNEPNDGYAWYPSPSAILYTALLQAAYPAIKTADPAARVISAGLAIGGSSQDPVAYLQQMYTNGAQGYMDYVGYHPYSWPNGPDYVGSGATFSELATIYSTMTSNGDGNKQIMATEVGWPTYSGGVTEANQALYIQRVYTKIMHEGFRYVAIACIYDFLDDGTDTTNAEDNFGVLHADYSQKPAYNILQAVQNDYIVSQNNYTAKRYAPRIFGSTVFLSNMISAKRYAPRIFGSPAPLPNIPTPFTNTILYTRSGDIKENSRAGNLTVNTRSGNITLNEE